MQNLRTAAIDNEETLEKAASLLKVDSRQMLKALTMKSTLAMGEIIYSPMSKQQALDVRDAFVKGIYGRGFIWIVDKINKTIFKPKGDKGRVSIGVLDIFGFENFTMNR